MEGKKLALVLERYFKQLEHYGGNQEDCNKGTLDQEEKAGYYCACKISVVSKSSLFKETMKSITKLCKIVLMNTWQNKGFINSFY